ncbi:hypothetical protein [Natrinema soli]|uniref:Uncharacterized protein n=1 Tax=Natrinema soli TaxID=1930624 RepID=A0ABD5SLQ5_9EURY|nr:hypothetical protein [Natrinema soli]
MRVIREDDDAGRQPEFEGIVVNRDPLTLSDGTDEVVYEDIDADVGLGHRVTIADGLLVDEDATDDRPSKPRPPAEYDGGRIPYSERGDGQPVSEWRFAAERNRDAPPMSVLEPNPEDCEPNDPEPPVDSDRHYEAGIEQEMGDH